jgi:hypothetical protein
MRLLNGECALYAGARSTVQQSNFVYRNEAAVGSGSRRVSHPDTTDITGGAAAQSWDG